MTVFVRVAEQASFTAAADSLGLPKASVSQAVSQLESQVGARLLQRTTRRVSLTPDGQAYYERCRDLLADVDELESMFQQTPATVSGRLRVDMPTGLARNLVVPKLPDFLDNYPGIEFELSCSDRQVDLIREGFDCVLRVGNVHSSGLIARPLGRLSMANCVSPGYIERWGKPEHPAELSNHRLIDYSQTLGSQTGDFEYLDGQRHSTCQVPVALTVNSIMAYTSACLAGLGIIQAPRAGVLTYLNEGVLVEVLEDFPAEPMPLSMVYPNRRHQAQRLKVFMNWVEEVTEGYVD
ncbi:LysR family transcriptional regulator [Gilvimarinus algae]|uniref:LysR family transcriptional regulator n=1 Tax=Gilvimarinus algae TaxID=3058037 RepID=A0ABT8TIQ0_9GAMM|nr:LysR family transcriptional regulator [Gilvimarinus sp. SDUM040014]MDO3383975.1 LysR family transcriptional regulator [Gilvimarinus sp. SDUM040014]